MLMNYTDIIEWDPQEKVWVTSVPALDDLSTFGETKEEAIIGYIEAASKEGIPLPAENFAPELINLEIAV